jgi:hypothetical protein
LRGEEEETRGRKRWREEKKKRHPGAKREDWEEQNAGVREKDTLASRKGDVDLSK